MQSHEFFSSIAAQYKTYRPAYPPEVVDCILQATSGSTRDLCVDVACGSGQLTTLLAPAFTRTVGVDKGAGQIQQARSDVHIKQLEFVEGDAHKIPLPAESAELLTCAQALHWFLDDQTFAEFHRVLKRECGIFAALSYAQPAPVDERIDAAFKHFYWNRLGSHLAPGSPGCAWQCDRRLVDSGYADVQFPAHLFAELPSGSRHRFTVRKTLSKEAFLNYLRTFSALENLKESLPNPVEEFSDMLTAISADSVEFDVSFHVVLMRRVG